MLKVDYSKTEQPNPNCEHKVVELLDKQYDKLTRVKELSIMCSECGEQWRKMK